MANAPPADRSRLPLVPLAPLPAPLTSFVGREREVEQVEALLRRGDVRLITLTGPGGVGKTRLALRVAEELASDFANGVAFVSLATISDPDLVAPTVARVLLVREVGDRSLAEQLTDALRDQRLFLVLDNLEQVVEAAPHFVSLLAACPRLNALVTSRIVLHVSGEHVVTVSPLGLPKPHHLSSAEAIAGAEAVRLFVARARAVRSDFGLTNANASAVAAVVRRLDGLPLAIELAAGRISHLSPVALLERMDKRLPLLTGGARDLPMHQRTVRDTIAWSYELLTAEEQTLFRRLAVFVGGFDLDAAQVVAGSNLDALAGIAALVDASLLHRLDGPDVAPRFAPLETVREFALERLTASREEPPLRDRHANWCLALAERGFAALVLARSVEPGWLDRLEAERGNLLTAFSWLEEAGDAEGFQRLAGALGPFWFFHSHPTEGRHWLERALARESRGVPDVRARVLVGLGVILQVLGDPDRAAALVEQGMELWDAAGEMALATQARLLLGWLAVKAGAYGGAVLHLDAAGERFRELGADWWIAKGLYHRGEAALGQAALGQAREIFAEALSRYQGPNDPWGVASSLQGLGAVACDRGDCVQAARHYRDGLALWHSVGTREGVATWLAGVATLAEACGEPASAARLFGATLGLCQTLGLAFGLPERARFVRAEANACAALGEAAFAPERAAGRALTPEQAIGEALAVLQAVATASSCQEGEAAASDPGLTRREREVLCSVVDGAIDREIAAALSISPAPSAATSTIS